MRLARFAHRFYPGNPVQLAALVDKLLAQAPSVRPASMVVVPHAGYLYSGSVAGQVFGSVEVPDTVILLGPRHTRGGPTSSISFEDGWQTPLGTVPVDQALCEKLVYSPHLVRHDQPHVDEHSLEVLLPFLQRKNPKVQIVPVAIGNNNVETLTAIAHHLGDQLENHAKPFLIATSSDMSHYINAEKARRLDQLAINQMLGLNPLNLLRIVSDYRITMCGVLPVAVGMMALLRMECLGTGELVAYANSGEVSGDLDQVVGYAGVRFLQNE